MRKVRFLTLLTLISIALMLVSCKTAETELSYSDEEYDHVFGIVLEEAKSSSIMAIFKSLNEGTENMIPSEYSFFEQYRDQVPGLDRLLDNWAQTTMNYLVPSFDTFQKFISELFSSTASPNSRELLSAEDDSISKYYKAQCYGAIKENIDSFLSGLDITELREAIIQYNAWSSTRALLYDNENPYARMDYSDAELRSVVSEYLVDLFFSYFARYETLFRTTPDPEMESLAAAILGLQ